MKRAIFFFLANLMILSAFAQNSNVNKANSYLDQEDKLGEAKELIDAAIEHEKTKDKGRTWFVRGSVYSSIARSTNPEVRALDEDAVQKTVESFKKVQELEKEGTNYHTLSEVQLGSLFGEVFNQGVESYQNDEFMEAYKHFKDLIVINPKDTVGYLYGGFCAEAAGEYDMALEMYDEAMQLEDCPTSIYAQTIVIYESQKEDLEKALEVTTEAMNRFPENKNFPKNQIAYFIRLDRTEEAQQALEKALENEPENANLWYNLGYLYGETGEYEKSVEAYKKSIEADPEYIDSYINLAYTYTEKGKEVRQEAMDMDMKTYQQKGAAIEKAADEYYKEAVPVLEAADKVKPDDQAILESLNGLYIRLKMNDKAEALYDRLVALGFIQEEGN